MNFNFKRAILWGSDFIGCGLEWCDFEEADLGGCRFDKSSMEYVPSVYEDPKRVASLRGTKLGGAKLEGAIVYGADFSSAIDVRRDVGKNC